MAEIHEVFGKVSPDLQLISSLTGYSSFHLSKVFTKTLRMSWKLAKALELASQGQLKANDLMEEFGGGIRKETRGRKRKKRV